jgi:hypothetical protein
MRLYQLIFRENPCYKVNRKITPRGGMLPPTGDNNSELRRCVNQDDGQLGRGLYNNHWSMDVQGRGSSSTPSSELSLSPGMLTDTKVRRFVRF